MSISDTWIRALTQCALRGVLVGNFVLGYEHYYEGKKHDGRGSRRRGGVGWSQQYPLGVVLAALLFATPSQGGLAKTR